MKQPPYQAPEFSLADETGKTRSLKDYKGKWVVLYFYPKDDTPGCTVEACSLRDARDDIAELNAEIIGVSADDIPSHEKFKANHSLNFTLLSDPEKKLLKHTVLGVKRCLAKREFCAARLLLTQKE